MSIKKIDEIEEKVGEGELANTRGWIFDALMESGQKLAMVNHLEEKISGLLSKIANEVDADAAYKMVDKVANMRELVEMITTDRRKLMDYILQSSNAASDEERCLLKHALLDYTIACELYEVNPKDDFLEQNMLTTSASLAGVISLTLGMEFKTCMRCLADKFSKK